MYSGNLGLAHDYKTFVNGYKDFIKENPNTLNCGLMRRVNH